jgi:O-antigen/teichoic acid export membrane protein
MQISRLAVLKGVGWTVGGFSVGQLLRLVTIVAIARLLAPELFGIMAIVNSLRTGFDLVSDIGIGQNIIQNKNSEDPDFYNTAWTLQLIRGPFLCLICSAAAVPFASLYNTPELIFVLPVASFYFLILGSTSISIFLLQRRLQFAIVNLFELFYELVSAVAHLLFAYLNPTVWALVFAGLVAHAARMIASYFLLPDIQHKFRLCKPYAWQILRFGKWIFLASLVYFLSMNFDRLFLGKVAPLALLGAYGIARSLSDPIGALVVRLGNYIVFPIFASSSDISRDDLRTQVVSLRMKSLTLAALGLSLFAAVADLPVKILFDQRYQATAWMLPLLAIGLWFSIICSINETTLLGFGKAHYSAIANSLKLGYLLIALPLGFMQYGALGAVMVIAVSDASRYGPILVGQIRERFSFGIQDFSITLILFALIAVWEWLRWAAGFGTSFDDVPWQ